MIEVWWFYENVTLNQRKRFENRQKKETAEKAKMYDCSRIRTCAGKPNWFRVNPLNHSGTQSFGHCLVLTLSVIWISNTIMPTSLQTLHTLSNFDLEIETWIKSNICPKSLNEELMKSNISRLNHSNCQIWRIDMSSRNSLILKIWMVTQMLIEWWSLGAHLRRLAW